MDPITGALIAAGGSMITGMLNNSAASSRQEDAQAFSAEQYATRYQTTVKDMQAAGLNPMLSYSQGAGTAPSSAAASSSGTPDLGASFSQGRIASAQSANLQADTDKKGQETKTGAADEELKKSQARNLDADTLTKMQMPELIKSQVLSYTANARSLDAGIRKMEEEMKSIIANVNNIKSQEERNKAETAAIPSLIALRKAQAFLEGKYGEIQESNVKAIKDTGGVGRIAREIQPASDIASDWLNPAKWFTSKSKTTVQKGK